MGNGCTKFFDSNRNDRVSAKEVIQTIGQWLGLVEIVVNTTKGIVTHLEKMGIDTKDVNEVLSKINAIAEGVEVLANDLKLPKDLKDIQDVNADGLVNSKDMLIYLQKADLLCQMLIQAGVNSNPLHIFQGELKKSIDLIKSHTKAIDAAAAEKPTQPTSAATAIV